ncbi:formate dehydrogenase subunit alpha [Porticoccus sp.]
MVSRTTTTICPFCGVGCGLNLRTEGDRLIAVEPQLDHPVSRGQLCSKGWSSAYGIDLRERILHPLIRTPGGFRQASWDEALATIGDGLQQILDEAGPMAVGIISSARATNEDNYAAQKLARAVLKTNNVDHCARICHSPTVAGLKQTLGSGAMTNSAADIFETELILVFGADPTENHAILGGHIIRAHLAGTRLIVVDPRRTRLAKLADMHLQLKPGSNIALINALLKTILDNHWQDSEFIEARCEGLAPLAAAVADAYEGVESATGIDLETIRETARAYSKASRAMMFYGMGITQYVSGTNNVIALSNLALVCGQIGRPGTGINPLRGQNNVQGACDMGCLPNVYPGYQPVADPAVREKFSRAWKTALPEQPGLTSLGMSKAALDGIFRALILFGEDPVITDPDQNQERLALSRLDLLVVAELTMTDTARMADVVLPAASFAEKSGTFTNCERRVQHVRQALPPPGEARGDWQWLAAIARQLGSDQLDWADSEAVFREMAALTPSYSAMSYPRLDEHSGLQWPCSAETPEGTPVLHRNSFPIGRARLIPVHATAIDEPADAEYPLLLTTNRLHFHYGCGSMTRKSPLLEREIPPGLLFINPADARGLGIAHRAPVGVRSRRGYLETCAMLSEDLPPGLVSMPYHFREAPSNQLTNNAQDPVTKMPELKACAVAVEPLPPGQVPRTMDQLNAERGGIGI